MREHHPGVEKPPEVPPGEDCPGDITRTDSYSLTRGGKLVSSHPWGAPRVQVLPTMHVLDPQGKKPSDKCSRPCSTLGSSSSDTESDSGDSDVTSEDEYEVRACLLPPSYTHNTITEEDDTEYDSCMQVNHSESEDVKESETGGCENEQRLPGDGHSRPHIAQEVRDAREAESEDEGSESEDSESEETESTVRARLEAHLEDHNDTLSTVSEDLSFEDEVYQCGSQDGGLVGGCDAAGVPSPAHTTPTPATHHHTHADMHNSAHEPQGAGGRRSTPEPQAIERRRVTSEEPQGTTGRRIPSEDLQGTAGKIPSEDLQGTAGKIPSEDLQGTAGKIPSEDLQETAGRRVPPEGKRCTPQREGVRAGVFCLSGYPRQGTGGTLDTPSHLTPSTHNYLSQAQHTVRCSEFGDGEKHDGERGQVRELQVPGLQYSTQSRYNHGPDMTFPPRVGSHSRAAGLRGLENPIALKEHSSTYENTSDYHTHCLSLNNIDSLYQHGVSQTSSGGSNRELQESSATQQQRRPHTQQVLSKYQGEPQQEPPQHSQQVHNNRKDASNASNASSSSSSNNTREGGCGGSGRASPAHTHPTPTPRLLASSSGLSGSTSRLAGTSTGYGALATRLGGSFTALPSSTSSGYGSCAGGVLPSSSRHEDSEDLSDVSSGATSEDSARRRRRRSSQPMKGEASVSGNEDFEWVRGSPMLTGLLEGHVTRLSTPPDHRLHSQRSTLTTPPESGEEGVSSHRHRQYTRPPPVPRPRTLEAGDLVPHRYIREALRASRDSTRDRLYSPSRDLTGYRRSRDSSVERSGRDSSCERGSVSSLHQHSHHHHHVTPRLPQHSCECPSCWCDEDEPGYDSCDERNHHHRHSYHEGLQHAHLHQPHHHHHHHQQPPRELSRERRIRSHGSADSGRSSPCCCRNNHQLGSLTSLSSHDYCNNTRLALPSTAKGSSLEERVNRLEGDKDSLQLQVTVLTQQVEAQTEKIADLENLLEEKKAQLQKTEEQLQKEVMGRSNLETQCLELVSEISTLKLRQAAYERENIDLREKIRRSDHHSDHAKAQPIVSGTGVGRTSSFRSITPAAASTPVHSFLVTPDSPQPSHQLAAQLTNSPSPSSISTLSTIPASSPNKSPAQPITASPASSPVASHDARQFMPPRTPPPNARRKIDHFGTVPRQREAGVCGENNHGASAAGRAKGVMFGKGFHFLPFRVAGKRSTSAPNLAETEIQMIDDLPEGDYYPPVDGVVQSASSSPRCNTLTGHRSPPTHHKATGIKKIFTRLRRSSSGHLESDLGDGDFRRGGMRATASARLGWTSPTISFKEPNETFSGWSIETVEGWLGALGLSQYCSAVRTWSSSGHHLSKATPQQLERELGIRHPLHRKKLQLAIAARMSGEQINTPLSRLDHSWVLRWLDDVGLPQYKDSFSEARIDGRVLNCLTYDDLSFLRLSNLLHVTSLKRGIQVLREHNFDPSVLKRRSVPDEGQRIRTAAEVALWTNHRVMEWLRTVDLSEYAPNLRGSGVHGALMVYEVRFNSEVLAALLSIPSGKTLLRRHLNTHFKELVGRSVVQEKRELEASSGYTPLTTSAKVKMPKKSQFSLKRKKSKAETDFDDLLCPLDEKPPVGAMQDKEKERLQRASAPPVIGRITKV
ncbi:filaggrin isoform X4 [Cherax quadricarinatus]|uniref:filaggrin isoform X4 n=1 Tax=Cherax quadricarinatus TaxID=27406 RepID=UPI002377F70E|nr:uncharacterized protein LOC128701729 isoform X4 [Cherax quadricarinatus]